jgi:site-specific DNA recombinase
VQEVLTEKGQRRTRQQKHRWAFQGLLTYGHCGCAITAEIKQGRYVYYHCTGYKGKCPEKYVREEDIAAQ